MHSTQNAVANHEYRSVPIAALAESATNRRNALMPRAEAIRLDQTSISGLPVTLALPQITSSGTILPRWQFSQYCPPTSSAGATTAAHTEVAAPCGMVLKPPCDSTMERQ